MDKDLKLRHKKSLLEDKKLLKDFMKDSIQRKISLINRLVNINDLTNDMTIGETTLFNLNLIDKRERLQHH